MNFREGKPRPFATFLMFFFSFFSIAIYFPERVSAQDISEKNSPQEQLEDELNILTMRIENVNRLLLNNIELIAQIKTKAPLSSEPRPALPFELLRQNPAENAGCTECDNWHYQYNKITEMHPLFKVGNPSLLLQSTDKFFESLKQFFKNPYLYDISHLSHMVNHLQREMEFLKTKIETYLSLDLPWYFYPDKIITYTSLLIDFFIIERLISSESLEKKYPYDTEKKFTIKITEATYQKIMNYLSMPISPDGSNQSKKDFLSQMIRFEKVPNDQGYEIKYTDDFRMKIELSSHFRNSNEASLIELLKIITSEYFTTQLLSLENIWPELQKYNAPFFKDLIAQFPSFKRRLGILLENKIISQKEAYREKFIEHLKNLKLQTLFSNQRLISLFARTVTLKHLSQKEHEEYIKKHDFLEKEAVSTFSNLTRYFTEGKDFDFFEKKSISEKAQWLRNFILDAKTEFVRQKLLLLFVNCKPYPELSPQIVPEIMDTWKHQYEQELRLHDLETWVQETENIIQSPSTIDPINRYIEDKYQVSSLPLQEAVFGEIEDNITSLLLHAFDQSIRWNRETVELIGMNERECHPPPKLKDYWNSTGMPEQKMTGVIPAPSLFNFSFKKETKTGAVIFLDSLPPMPIIAYSNENFKTLLAGLFSAFTSDPHFMKHAIQILREVSTKQDLLKALDDLIADLDRHIATPITELNPFHYYLWAKPKAFFGATLSTQEQAQYDHNRYEDIKKALIALKEKRFSHINQKNETTLDDCFSDESIREKIDFFKLKKAGFLNAIRHFSLPLKSGTGNPNHDWQEKILIDHLTHLKKQDGLLLPEIETFIHNQSLEMEAAVRKQREDLAFSLPDYLSLYQPNYSSITALYRDKLTAFFKNKPASIIDGILATNDAIIKELRQLEKKIKDSQWLPYDAYLNPHYFINYTDLPKMEKDTLARIQMLRKQRKEIYLDKGGEALDEWLKNFIRQWMVRRTLLHKDFILRKNIYRLLTATSVHDIKEFILDPFILNLALKQSDKKSGLLELPWKIKKFVELHKDLVRKHSQSSLLQAYNESEFRSAVMWGGIAASFILAFIPGCQIPSFILGSFFLAEFSVVSAYELHENFVELPKSYALKKEFFFSSTDLTGKDTDIPGSYQEYESYDQSLFWHQALSLGLTALFLLPQARGEVRQAIRVFHERTNLFITLKIPLFAKELGIDASQPLTLRLVNQKIAEKLGVDLSDVEKLALDHQTRKMMAQKLGTHAGDMLFEKLKFFHSPKVEAFIALTTIEGCMNALQTLGFKEGEWPSLKHILLKAEKMTGDRLSTITEREREAMTPSLRSLIQKEKEKIKEALTFLETHVNTIASMRFVQSPKAALDVLGLDIEKLPTRKGLEAFYTPIVHNDEEKMAAWHFIERLYDIEIEVEREMAALKKGLSSQEAMVEIQKATEMKIQTLSQSRIKNFSALKEAFDIIKHIP